MTYEESVKFFWKSKATITEFQEVKDEYGITTMGEVVIYEDLPCRVSYDETISKDKVEDGLELSQETKLFIGSEYTIKSGSKIAVTQLERTTYYESSGNPLVYEFHQEILLSNVMDNA